MTSDGLLQLFPPLSSTAILITATWLMTRFSRVKRLEAKSLVPRKDAALAIGYVSAAFLALAVVFFFRSQSIGKPLGTSKEYDLLRVLSEWSIYALISFLPVQVFLGIRHQNLESVGLTKRNWRLSVGVGSLLSVLWLVLNTEPERFLVSLFTVNTFYGFLYFLAVGFGEELLFRGFLQFRCSAWLGDHKGLLVASLIMASAHLPHRIFVVGMSPIQAAISSSFLIPISLLMGFLFLRTQNVIGPVVLHTVLDLASIL